MGCGGIYPQAAKVLPLIQYFDHMLPVSSKRERRAANALMTPITQLALVLLSLFSIACIVRSDGDSATGAEENQLLDTTVVKKSSHLENEPGALRTELKFPDNGGILMIDSNSCQIPDPAIDAATALQPMRVFTLANEIHAGLTKIVEDRGPRVEPELAESFSSKEDGRNFEFVLRKNLKFSDGTSMSASDVKWTWERALRKATADGRAIDVLGDIEGAAEVASGDSQKLRGIEVIDDRRLKVTLREPRAEFPMLLADPVASVLNPANVQRWDDVWEIRPMRRTRLPVVRSPLSPWVLGHSDL